MVGRKEVMINYGSWLPRLHNALTIALLGLLLGTCAPSYMVPSSGQFDSRFSRQVLQAAFDGILDYHIQKSSPRELAVWSLEGLEKLDPLLQVDADPRRLRLRRRNGNTAYLYLPADNDVSGWLATTVDGIVLARELSPTLADLGGEKIIDHMLTSMLQNFDRFSRYKNAAAADNSRAARHGFTGIGVSIEKTPDGVRIVTVYDAGPAAAAGLIEEDIFIAVDDIDTRQATPQEVAKLVRGRNGTEVRITMLRGEDIKRFTITRRPVVPQSVKLRRQDGFAIVRLTSFNKGTTKALRQAIRQDSRQNGKPLGLILDLRGNRGGLLNQAIDVSDLFLGNGKILITDGRNFRAKQRFTAEDAELAYGVPMAVLIDQRSASATEVLAAALQDNKRALLIGSRTFGKGTVQTVIRLPDGGEMTVTWARMFAPSGYALSTYGVFPDICIINLASDNAGNPSALRSASDEAMQLLDQRRNSANLSEVKQQALLASCGPKTLSTANGDEALSIAKTILGNPSIANIPTQ